MLRKVFKNLFIPVVLFCGLLLAGVGPAKADTRLTKDEKSIIIDRSISTWEFSQFIDCVRTLIHNRPDRKTIDIILDTDGGDAQATISIMNYIRFMKSRGYRFRGTVFSHALSGGSYIFVMCDERIMYPGAQLMFHSLQIQYKGKEARWINLPYHAKKWTENIDDYLVAMVAACIGKTHDFVRKNYTHKDVCVYLSTQQAVAGGFVTSVPE